jgi:hypothetical protein
MMVTIRRLKLPWKKKRRGSRDENLSKDRKNSHVSRLYAMYMDK